MIKKILTLIGAFIIFSVYPSLAIYTMIQYNLLYLIFVPIGLAYLLGMGWSIYGQKTESSDQFFYLPGQLGIMILFGPSYLLIKSIRSILYKSDSSSIEVKVKLNLNINKYDLIKSSLPVQKINENIKTILASNRVLDSNHALSGYGNDNEFVLYSNTIFMKIFGNKHSGKFIEVGKETTSIKIRSRISLSSILSCATIFILSLIILTRGFFDFFSISKNSPINSIIAFLLINSFVFFLIYLPVCFKRNREYKIILNEILGNPEI